ncbi:hypothetical protein BV378_24680 [Nostoc sp. RF31YmG]|jgi:hypothetical protein|nr:hypothetical protein BV378_24680 [Nostoc sp. RF31YmG]
MTKRKMGDMKLSNFSGIKTQEENLEVSSSEPILEPEKSSSIPEPLAREKPVTSIQEPATKEKPVTVNIKITRTQHEWLTDTARTVRDNNDTPVPPGDRVYPQHLIGVAIELLQASDINWNEVRNVEDLKQQLNI